VTVPCARGAAAPVTPAGINTFPFIIKLVIVLDAAATWAARVFQNSRSHALASTINYMKSQI
jgi:hypothetical protein